MIWSALSFGLPRISISLFFLISSLLRPLPNLSLSPLITYNQTVSLFPLLSCAVFGEVLEVEPLFLSHLFICSLAALTAKQKPIWGWHTTNSQYTAACAKWISSAHMACGASSSINGVINWVSDSGLFDFWLPSSIKFHLICFRTFCILPKNRESFLLHSWDILGEAITDSPSL